jgi:hypothetical protein
MLGALALFAGLLPTQASASDGVYQPGSIDVPEGKAVIVLYRAFKLTGAAWPHRMFIDGKEVVGLKSRFYTSIVVSPGAHRVSVWPEDNVWHVALDLVAADGQVSFVRYLPGQISLDPGYGSRPSLTEVPASEAEPDIAKRKYRMQAPDILEIGSADVPAVPPQEVTP